MTTDKTEKDFNRYELEGADNQIDSYFGYPHHPPIPPHQDFEEAKARTIHQLRQRLACVEVISYERFKTDRRRGFFKGLYPQPKCPHLAKNQCPIENSNPNNKD